MKKCLNPDPGSGLSQWLGTDPDSGIKHLGTATLTVCNKHKIPGND
jgi:hypothetical protein